MLGLAHTYGKDDGDIIGHIPDRVSQKHLCNPSHGPVYCIRRLRALGLFVFVRIDIDDQCMSSLSVVSTPPDIGNLRNSAARR
jgi:hypothetical protein